MLHFSITASITFITMLFVLLILCHIFNVQSQTPRYQFNSSFTISSATFAQSWP